MNKTENIDIPIVVLKKRGRKPKNENIKLETILEPNNNIITENSINKIIENIDMDIVDEYKCKEDYLLQEEKKEPNIPKKRGRKPKGGKIIQKTIFENNNKEDKPNIILHLKCILKDLQTNSLSQDVESFHFPNINKLTYDIIDTEFKNENNNNKHSMLGLEVDQPISEDAINNVYEQKLCKSNDTKEIWKKLKILEHNLHINNICDKKSACFWCTYGFDNPPVYIPKHFINESYHVYGCFCSPECATAYLMEENIDSSSKFERYQLMNHIYSKIYNYQKNIKPSPNPYYMLDKYYGNLTIQEYRSLLRNERLFLIVDKPLTRILPELHEENDDFIITNKIIPSNTYQVKKKLQKKTSKNEFLSEQFGLSQ